MKLILGKEYKRTDLHDFYNGQRQGGISTPADRDIILIFTGPMGDAFGYEDGYDEDGRFHYTGEGQIGDMALAKGNRAIKDHEAEGKSLHLFSTSKRSHVKYEGQFSCVDYEIFRSSDRDDNPRDAIRFILEKVARQPARSSSAPITTAQLKPPNKTERRGLVTTRVGQGYYRQQLVDKYAEQCAVTRSGPKEILIASHIVPWRDATDAERLNPDNGILLSPIYDALFDRNLISFADNGEIIVSKLLTPAEMEAFSIVGNEQIETTPGMMAFLARHRSALR